MSLFGKFLSRRVAERVAENEEDRLALFHLAPSEQPVESLRVLAAAMHPRLVNGDPAPIATLKSFEKGGGRNLDDWLADQGWTPVLLDSILLLTDRSIRWRPFRAYQGVVPKRNRFLEMPLPFERQAGAKPVYTFDRDSAYLAYDIDALGARAVPLSTLSNISVEGTKGSGLRQYPERIVITQRNGTARAAPWWPCFDMHPFVKVPTADPRLGETGRLVNELLAKVDAATRATRGFGINPVTDVGWDDSPTYEFLLGGGSEAMVSDLALGFAHVDVPTALNESVGYLRQTYDVKRTERWRPLHERMASLNEPPP